MTGKKKWIAIAGLFVVTFVLMFFYARQMRQNRMQKDIAKEILRLHVVANSDSKKDQALKMEVKEAVVTYLRGVMQDAESVDEARRTGAEYSGGRRAVRSGRQGMRCGKARTR